GSRVPLAYLISKPELMGLNGVWWSITLTSILKGILMISIFIWLLKTGKLYSIFKDKNNLNTEPLKE
ncbi:MAG TPA: MATE family efflux transporter, partial [Romboutsia sp.]|nr:MATE family efflux transporter [Romboutsia sp.]